MGIVSVRVRVQWASAGAVGVRRFVEYAGMCRKKRRSSVSSKNDGDARVDFGERGRNTERSREWITITLAQLRD